MNGPTYWVYIVVFQGRKTVWRNDVSTLFNISGYHSQIADGYCCKRGEKNLYSMQAWFLQWGVGTQQAPSAKTAGRLIGARQKISSQSVCKIQSYTLWRKVEIKYQTSPIVQWLRCVRFGNVDLKFKGCLKAWLNLVRFWMASDYQNPNLDAIKIMACSLNGWLSPVWVVWLCLYVVLLEWWRQTAGWVYLFYLERDLNLQPRERLLEFDARFRPLSHHGRCLIGSF